MARAKEGEGMTIREAKRLDSPVVYGLTDASGVVFYVGKTISPKRRFQAHSENKGPNAGLRRRIAEAGDGLRVVVLRWKPEDLNAAEREEIRRHEPTIVNLTLADSWAWSKHSDVPWAAGGGNLAPTAFAIGKVGPDQRNGIRRALSDMTVERRCWCEVELLLDLPPFARRRFQNWWSIAGPKIAKVIDIDFAKVEAFLCQPLAIPSTNGSPRP